MNQTLTFLHTAPLVIAPFTALAKELLPDVEIVHMVDESLLRNTIRVGRLEKVTLRRAVQHVVSAVEGGTDAVLVTCSSIGPAADLAAQLVDVPVIRIDRAMADVAVRRARRIGVLATLRSTLDPTSALLREQAAAAGEPGTTVHARLCKGAFEAAQAGDTATHDRIVAEALRNLMTEVELVVLAQASMARVADQIPAEERQIPILTSPRLAMEQVRVTLAARDARIRVIGEPEATREIRGAC